MHGAARGKGRAGLLGRSRRPARGRELDAIAAHDPRRPQPNSWGSSSASIRVIAPDVGGGFGYKVVLQPEELCVAWLAYTRRHPVRWTEDRREHLTAGANTRQHHYRVAAYADARGQAAGASMPRSPSISAPIRCGPSPPGSKARWRAAICPAPITCRPIAAAPFRWRPTSRPSCPIARWRGRACASPSS